ncbi:hypothetical protein L484_017468 [Morus notabilis]|uniref:DUF4408 domain-containing protein n=2 Tax=Morus notabilis TaxID=981085 RepID=W9R7T7_9ROSA|nr:hypothetical protein L484_017468 [Morus notabilis]
MKCYKNSQFVYNLILSSFVALTCSFFCSHPFGFASQTSSIKYSLFIYLPNIWSSFLNPKCLFIVFNVIVAFLVGESKLLGSQPSPANDIYDEYVARSRRFQGQHKYFSNLGEEQKEERKLEVLDVSKEIVYEDKEIALEDKQDKHDHEKLEEEEEEEEEEDDDEEFKEAENNIDSEHEERDCEEDSEGLPAEELNRRVEDFIARINKQRWFEARMMICGQA